MVKLRNNKFIIKTIELKLEIAKEKVIALETELHKIKCDILEPSVTCCGKTFISHIDLKFHNNTKTCLNKEKPQMKCNLCRNVFYGLTNCEVATLGIGNPKYDLSDYGKHVVGCHTCLKCGYLYKGHRDKKNHKCNENITINNINHIVEPEPEPESDVDDNRPLSNTSNISTSSEYSEWEYDNINYLVNNKNNVYDLYDNHVGQKVKDAFSGDYKLV